jgi:hypothetical protein
MNKVLIALLTCDTSHSGDHCRKSLMEKQQLLFNALMACQDMVTAKKSAIKQDNDFHAIFAAPKYYFTDAGDHRKPMSELAQGVRHRPQRHGGQRSAHPGGGEGRRRAAGSAVAARASGAPGSRSSGVGAKRSALPATTRPTPLT